MGRIENPDGDWRAGQFITADVDLPETTDQVRIPASALLDDGRTTTVLVERERGKQQFVRCRVYVARRSAEVIFISNAFIGAPDEHSYCRLHVGDRVVSSGAIEVAAALKTLIDKSRNHH